MYGQIVLQTHYQNTISYTHTHTSFMDYSTHIQSAILLTLSKQHENTNVSKQYRKETSFHIGRYV